jgi:hypothetical protein
MKIGRTTDSSFTIARNGTTLVDASVSELSRIWRSAFALLLGGDTIDEVVRGVGEEAAEVIAR